MQRDYQWEYQECQALIEDLDRAFLLSKSGSAFAAHAPVDQTVTSVGMRSTDEADAGEDDIAAANLEAFEPATDIPPGTTKAYFLGTIALGPSDQDRRVSIYDGLQRLTTLTILIAVIRDMPGHKAESDLLHKTVFDNQAPRLRLLARDGMLYKTVQLRGATIKAHEDQAISDTAERIRGAVVLYREATELWSVERRRAFLRFLLDSVYLVVINVEDATLAFQLFYTTNTRGKRLESADILKAQIHDLVATERGGEVADQLASQWTHLQRRFGDGLEDYLRAMDFYYRRTRQRENVWVQELFETLRTKKHATRFVGWLATAERHWAAIQNAKSAAPPLSATNAALRRLWMFDGDYWEGVALGVLMSARKHKAELLFRLEQACLLMALIGEQARDRPQILANALSSLGGNDAWTPYPLTTQRLERAQLKLSRALDERFARNAVRWLEAMRQGAKADQSLKASTLEHVLPQKGVQETSQWRVDFPDVTKHYDLAWQIGNLTLLSDQGNKAAGNKDFLLKQPIYRAEPIRYSLLADVIDTSNWTPRTLEARTTRLASEMLDLLTRSKAPAP